MLSEEPGWVSTNEYVFRNIWIAHRDRLKVFSSFTNMEPSQYSSTPQMDTSWGIDGYDAPLIRCWVRWEEGKRNETERYEYYIASYCYEKE